MKRPPLLLWQRIQDPFRNETGFAFISTLFFFITVLVGILHHEMWRDEWQAWLIVQECDSLKKFFTRIRIEGHPPLWYFSLYMVQKLTENPLGMQVFHVLVASASVFLFMRFAPLSRRMRLLFPAGYFPLFEYALISRNYVLTLFFVMLFCALFKKSRSVWLVLVLAGMAVSSVQGFLIALPLAMVLLWETVRRLSGSARPIVLVAIALVVGVAATWLSSLDPVRRIGNQIAGKAEFDSRKAVRVVNIIWNAYVPVPVRSNRQNWNTNILETYNSWELMSDAPGLRISDPLGNQEWSAFALSMLILLLAGLSIGHDGRALFVFAACTILLLLLAYFVLFGWLRHHGFLFVSYILCFWIGETSSRQRGNTTLYTSYRKGFLGVLLVVQLLGGLFSYVNDLQHPFSACKRTAEYIRENHLEELPIMGVHDFVVAPVAGELGKEFLSVDTGKFTRSVNWSVYRVGDSEKFIRRIGRLYYEAKHSAFLLISDYPIGSVPFAPRQGIGSKAFQLTPIGVFPAGIVPDEKYIVFYLQEHGGALPADIAPLKAGKTMRF